MNHLARVKNIVVYFVLALVVCVSICRATEEMEDPAFDQLPEWPLLKPTSKRAVAFLNKLVMAAQRGGAGGFYLPQQQQEHYRHQQKVHLLPAQLEMRQQPPVLADSEEPMELAPVVKELPPVLPRNHLVETGDSRSTNSQRQQQQAIALPRMGFERRGQQAPRVFWRCYFNAVSCFR